jgi:hypothetical protein
MNRRDLDVLRQARLGRCFIVRVVRWRIVIIGLSRWGSVLFVEIVRQRVGSRFEWALGTRIQVHRLIRLILLSIFYTRSVTLGADFVSVVQFETHIWGIYVLSPDRFTRLDPSARSPSAGTASSAHRFRGL